MRYGSSEGRYPEGFGNSSASYYVLGKPGLRELLGCIVPGLG